MLSAALVLALSGPVVVIIAGQSNAVGYAPTLAEDRLPVTGVPVSVINNVAQLQDSHEPYSAKPGAGVSFGRTFALRLLADVPEVTRVWLVQCAVGGTGSLQWVPGSQAQRLEQCVARTRLLVHALEEPDRPPLPVVAVLWHQGESDCSPRLSHTYGDRLSLIITGFKTAFPGVAFVAGELENPSRWGDYTASQWSVVVEATRARADAFVPAVDLPLLPTSQHHFSRPALRTLGERYAVALEGIR
jgi:Carbohydrate esterase, sialic acid-specific acetylesterase